MHLGGQVLRVVGAEAAGHPSRELRGAGSERRKTDPHAASCTVRFGLSTSEISERSCSRRRLRARPFSRSRVPRPGAR